MLTGLVLGAAAMTAGLVAGVFILYAHTIMPGLGRTDDRTFVGAFQAVDRAIINPWFMSCFFGALVLTGVSAALHLRADGHGGLPWIAVAFLLYLMVVVITLTVNVPLNDAIKAAGDPERIADLARVRRDFDEARWRAWNLVRVVLSSTAFGCLLVALVMYGRRR
ncbi:anthrone oxygenase family protein [Plantactinospora sp. ZYX-F-223]|uniref:anthrone oxygenase family protein n=1 Tax=Plantactinospora sp. ZYX-F-223 TaxID=3144103 RepID=UPI0031FCB9E4